MFVLGTIETPIVLTNTLAVGTAVEAVVAYTLAQPGNGSVRSVNALVGETNDAGSNDIRRMPVTRTHVIAAIRDAKEGPVAEGNVGAGTGTQCFGWKGGIGTSSRKLPARYGGYTLGVLVQSNFGGVLTIAGAPVGKELGRYAFAPERKGIGGPGDGSCLILVATDAPLDARDLRRLAARAVFGMARTGSSYANGSGDYAIAFSTSSECRFRAGETQPRRERSCPRMPFRPCSRRPSRPRKRQSTIRCFRPPICATEAGRSKRSRSRGCGRSSRNTESCPRRRRPVKRNRPANGSQQVALAYRAACTPDFYVSDKNRKLVYRGQFDGSRPSNAVPITGNDLRWRGPRGQAGQRRPAGKHGLQYQVEARQRARILLRGAWCATSLFKNRESREPGSGPSWSEADRLTS